MLLKKNLLHVLNIIKKQNCGLSILIGNVLYSFLKKKYLFYFGSFLKLFFFKKLAVIFFKYGIKIFVPSIMFLNIGIVYLVNFFGFFTNNFIFKINYFMKKIKPYTILRSPFVHKKSMEQLGSNMYFSEIALVLGNKKIIFVMYLENLFKKYISLLRFLKILIKKKMFIK